MVRFAICDDDRENMMYMKNHILEAYENNYNKNDINFYLYYSSEELIHSYLEDKIDVAFIDIELENEKLGFDVARKLCDLKRNPAIVYMSSHEHYVTKGYVCRPLGFVRKKEAREDLKIVMAEIKIYLSEENKTMTFYHNSTPIEIDLRSIYSIEVYDHELCITKLHDEIRLRDQMVKHSTELEENGFLMIKRGVAVNLKYIDKFENYYVILSNGKKLDVSRDRMKLLKQKWIISKLR